MKNIVFSATLLLCVMLIGSCSNQQNTLRIGYLPVTSNLPLFVAMENGYFSEKNITVELVRFESSNALGEALISGSIDMEAGTSSFVTAALAQNSNRMKVFMTTNADENKYMSSFLTRNTPDVAAISDVKNKKIGCFPGAAIKAYTKLFLIKNKALGPKTEFVELPPPLQLQALESGAVDAVMCVEPTGTVARVTRKARVLLHGAIERDVIQPWAGGVYSFNEEYAKSQPEQTQEVVNIVKQAVEYLKQNESKAKLTLKKYTAVKDNLVLQEIPVLNFEFVTKNNIDKLQNVANILFEEKILKSQVNMKSILYMSAQ